MGKKCTSEIHHSLQNSLEFWPQMSSIGEDYDDQHHIKNSPLLSLPFFHHLTASSFIV
jgi:hypothetical protein